MCRQITPDEQRVPCSRCGTCANPNDGWEHGWPLYGRIDLGCPSQIFGYLCGAQTIAEPEHFWVWGDGHPAAVVLEAQEVRFEWGNGYRYESAGRYRLCYACQKELIRVVGAFFGFPERAAIAKAAHPEGA